MSRGLIATVLVVAGCAEKAPASIGVDAYLSEYPSQYCAIQAECYPERYRDLYDNDDAACIEAATGPVERKLNEDDCDYSGERAAECIEYISSLDCDAWEMSENDACSVSVICGTD
jgi:hypothetical protein